ncbi:hypothetical protein [Candidatus Dactylopiibacterium carminicum]|uniref:hypothetical protein n=1 Tax=Candidatus Dactylopiibacterium carminicum TaxID=857335 RepID=UPI001140BA12|nr:hypothetical protein [Candidatus Dactylopiibacterium carminicum]
MIDAKGHRNACSSFEQYAISLEKSSQKPCLARFSNKRAGISTQSVGKPVDSHWIVPPNA